MIFGRHNHRLFASREKPSRLKSVSRPRIAVLETSQCMRFITICRNLSRFTRPGGEHGLFEVTKFDRECRFVEMHPAVEAMIGLESLPPGDFVLRWR